MRGANAQRVSVWHYVFLFLFLLAIIYGSFIVIGLSLGVVDFMQRRSLLMSPSQVKVEAFRPKWVVCGCERKRRREPRGNPVECVVCLDAIREGEPVKRLPCGHVFQSSCIDPWLLEEKAVCPTCRKGVFDDDESNWLMEGKNGEADRFVFRWGR